MILLFYQLRAFIVLSIISQMFYMYMYIATFRHVYAIFHCYIKIFM